MNIVLVGGGSSAHVLVPFLSGIGYSVNILTSKPNKWKKEILLKYKDVNNNVISTFRGEIDKVSSEASRLIPEADIIIFCMPVHKYREALHNIAPFININKNVFVGTVYGQAGFNWMVNEVVNANKYSNIITFAYGLIPWICRIEEYGAIGVTYGCKELNVVSVYPSVFFNFLNEAIFDKICYRWFNTGKTVQSDNFLSLTLSVDNQIIHTSRCYGLYLVYGRYWERQENVPLFYRNYDQLSADLLLDLDNDYSLIRDSIIDKHKKLNFRYMLDYLALERLSYNSSNTNVKESFVNSKTLGAIKTPVILADNGKWTLDYEHRFFKDDIHYGLCVAKWCAEKLSLSVPTIDKILHWVQEMRCESYIDDNNKLILDSPDLSDGFKSGIPAYYGFKTIDDIIG